MLCSRCNKRVAVVFISKFENNQQQNVGYCIKCAKELGIAPVDKLMNDMGISEDMLEDMENQFSEIVDSEEFEGMTQTFPFLNNFQKNQQNAETSKDSKNKDNKKEEKKTEYKFLSGYCTNLNQRAKDKKLDRIIGRDRETARIIQILCRRQKNNPCLIGEPGVGKTAVAEGLAIAITEGRVPEKLKDKEIYLVDLAAMVAGTQFRGQFESRLKGLINDVIKKGNVILVVDEVHNLVGTGDSEGSMSAANILKPSLSRGEIQVIGATTYNEYRKYIEKDAALERRFQPVTVEEPSISDTISIIKGIKEYYENFHHVIIPDNIIEQGVKMSERYITDRFLPDKAIDLFDEACSKVSINDDNLNEYLKLSKESAKLNKKLEELEGVDPDDKVFEQIAEIKSKMFPIEDKLEKLKDMSFPTLTISDLAKVIELWTGVPAEKTAHNDYENLIGLEDRIKDIIIGQDEAVEKVCNAVLRSRVSLSPVKKPASFIFVGATGVGKTYLVKTLANDLFDSPESLIRLDMSEFMEKHAVSRIIGSPPGYVGYDEAGQLTEKIRRKPYSVILFDEIEKAHPDVLNILLQILDEGHITDAHGRKVDFSNTIIVMTSNAGSDRRGDIAGFNKTTNSMAKEKAEKALSEFLRPEFINRIDEIVVFNKLSVENIRVICKSMLNEFKEALSVKGIDLTYDEAVLNYLAEKSNFDKFGARDVRRLIQREIEDKLTKTIIFNHDKTLTNVNISLSDGKIVIDTNIL
ncbi:MAG: ATP-dependent Clp protease ATP-binding subunit [Clostridia bacterium]|nr:ATP-dependent Clp protease ATP-binding subunit [Clostridia bacterium]